MLSPIPVFLVPMLIFQVNPTVEVCWPPKSNNDQTYDLIELRAPCSTNFDFYFRHTPSPEYKAIPPELHSLESTYIVYPGFQLYTRV